MRLREKTSVNTPATQVSNGKERGPTFLTLNIASSSSFVPSLHPLLAPPPLRRFLPLNSPSSEGVASSEPLESRSRLGSIGKQKRGRSRRSSSSPRLLEGRSGRSTELLPAYDEAKSERSKRRRRRGERESNARCYRYWVSLGEGEGNEEGA